MGGSSGASAVCGGGGGCEPWRGLRLCPAEESRRDPGPPVRRPIEAEAFTAWGDADAPELVPDDPADVALGVSKPVGSVRLPCGRGLATLVCTAYDGSPPPEVLAVPFRLPASGRVVWLQHELL